MGFGKERIRSSIAEKAKKLLFLSHPNEITMGSIAKELGVTAVTLYKYYRSKEDIIQAGYKEIVSEVTACADINLPSKINSKTKLMIVFKNLADYFFTNKLYPTWLVEDPRSLPVCLKKMRDILSGLFREYYGCDFDHAEKLTSRHLAMLQAELLYYRSTDKELPDNIIEEIFRYMEE